MSELMAAIDAVPDSVSFGITVLLVLALCALSNRQDHASPGPDAEKASGVRQGESPTEAPVVSGGALLDEFADAFASAPATGRRIKSRRLECSPEHDRASDLSSNDSTNVLLAERSPVVVRSTAAGAPAVIYRWVRPAEGKRLSAHGWWLEHVDPRYGTWLVKKEERW